MASRSVMCTASAALWCPRKRRHSSGRPSRRTGRARGGEGFLRLIRSVLLLSWCSSREGPCDQALVGHFAHGVLWALASEAAFFHAPVRHHVDAAARRLVHVHGAHLEMPCRAHG